MSTLEGCEMTIEQLRQVMESRPFRPFTMRLANGSRVHVPHPEFLWVPPKASRTVAVAVSDDALVLIDLLLVAAIDVGNGRTRRRG